MTGSCFSLEGVFVDLEGVPLEVFCYFFDGFYEEKMASN